MARERIGDTVLKVRVPDDLVARLDAVCGSRSDAVRTAIEEWLDRQDGGVVVEMPRKPLEAPRPERKKSDVVVPARKPEIRQPRKRDFSGDFPAVMEVLPEHRYSARELARRLGWAEMRLDKVLAAMEAAGLVRFERGLVVAA